MAKVPPPLRNQANFQARIPIAPPQIDQASNNLSTPSSGQQDMNFKVTPAFHREFKIEAALRGMSMKELLEAAFKTYLEKFPTHR